MAAPRRLVKLVISEEEMVMLRGVARSRTEPAARVERARMLLAYRDDPSFFAVGRALGRHHQTVQRCVDRAAAEGVAAALDDLPRPGAAPYDHRRGQGLGWWRWPVARRRSWAIRTNFGRPGCSPATRGNTGRRPGMTVSPAWSKAPCARSSMPRRLKPHKVRYYLERRDPEFETKMAEVLCVYREVAVLKQAKRRRKTRRPRSRSSPTTRSRASRRSATTAPDLPPRPGVHPGFARDHEYKRHGTLSLLAGIDLVSGKVHALVRDRHRSREFIEFLKLLDTAYATETAIKVILDNHSAHVSKETKTWLASQREGRFTFVFTPKHGSWLNLIEGFFSKLARSVLRHIRVASKQELKDRILAAIEDINRHPVVHTWSYKLDNAA